MSIHTKSPGAAETPPAGSGGGSAGPRNALIGLSHCRQVAGQQVGMPPVESRNALIGLSHCRHVGRSEQTSHERAEVAHWSFALQVSVENRVFDSTIRSRNALIGLSHCREERVAYSRAIAPVESQCPHWSFALQAVLRQLDVAGLQSQCPHWSFALQGHGQRADGDDEQ